MIDSLKKMLKSPKKADLNLASKSDLRSIQAQLVALKKLLGGEGGGGSPAMEKLAKEVKTAIQDMPKPLPPPPTPPLGPTIADFRTLEGKVEQIGDMIKESETRRAMKEALHQPPPGMKSLKEDMARALESMQEEIEIVQSNELVAAHKSEKQSHQLKQILAPYGALLHRIETKINQPPPAPPAVPPPPPPPATPPEAVQAFDALSQKVDALQDNFDEILSNEKVMMKMLREADAKTVPPPPQRPPPPPPEPTSEPEIVKDVRQLKDNFKQVLRNDKVMMKMLRKVDAKTVPPPPPPKPTSEPEIVKEVRQLKETLKEVLAQTTPRPGPTADDVLDGIKDDVSEVARDAVAKALRGGVQAPNHKGPTAKPTQIGDEWIWYPSR